MELLAKKAAAALLALLLALVLFTALLVSGVSYLFEGIQQALLPLSGAAGSHLATGLLCLLPILLAIRALQRRLSRPQVNSANAASGSPALRTPAKLAKQYPLEAAALAFFAGYSVEDKHCRELVLDTTRACIRDASDLP